ncbi:MAG: hypothetical protein WCJ01_11140 [Ignavibacteria bacterium]
MKIKQLLILIIILCFLSDDKTIFSQEIRHNAFIAPVIRNCSILNQYAMLAGLRGGWVIDETFVIGGAYYSLLNRVNSYYAPNPAGDRFNMELSMGGLEFELVYPSEKTIHGSLVLFMGGGGLKFIPENKSNVSPYGLSFVIWEPQLNSEFNLSGCLKLNLGIGYRIIKGFDDYYNIRQSDLTGLNGIISLKIGKY